MALVTANQFQLTPDIGGAISRGINTANQFQQMQQRGEQFSQQQEALTTEQERQAIKERFTSVAHAAVKAKNLPDDESRLKFLLQRKDELESKGIDPGDTLEALELFQSGQAEKGNLLIDSVIKTARQTGVLEVIKDDTPAGSIEFQNLLDIAQDPNATEIEKNSANRALGNLAKVGTLSIDERVSSDPELQKLITDYTVNKERQKAEAVEEVKTGEAGKRKAISIAVDFAKTSNDKIAGLDSLNTQYQSAIDQLNAGAESGVIDKMLPSINNSSLILDNIASQAGFDLAKSGGGIITEADMEWGMRTAIPQGLQPKELIKFLTKKQEAQSKIINNLKDATLFLGDGTKTLADWYRAQASSQDIKTATVIDRPLDEQAQEVNEGQIIVNPTTGERLQLVNGKFIGVK